MRDERDDDYVPIGVNRVYGPYGGKGKEPEYWKVIVRVAHKQSGKVVNRTTRAQSEEEAAGLREKALKLIQTGFCPERSEATVGDLLKTWREREERKKPLTPNRREMIRNTESTLRAFLPSENTALARAGARAKAAFAAWREAPSTRSHGPKEPRTLTTRLNMLLDFFNLAVAKKWLDKNPFKDVEKIRERGRRSPRPRHTVTEAITLWNYCRAVVERRKKAKPAWPACVQVALLLGAGLRVGEVMDLQVRGLDRGLFGPVLRTYDGKTENAARTVPLFESPWLLAAVKELCEGKDPLAPIFEQGILPDLSPDKIREKISQTGSQTRAAAALGVDRSQMMRVLRTQPTGEPIKYGSAIRQALRRTCVRAKVTPLSPHGLRRTYTDLRDMVSEQSVRSMVRSQARRSLGHAAGSNTMETSYLSPERTTNQESQDMGSVLRFLDSGGGPPANVHDEELMSLVEQVGPEQAKALLRTLSGVSGAFPGAAAANDQRRQN